MLGEYMDPALSLVTGTLNRQESFNRLVRSIVERTSVSWELIVSDASDQPYPDIYPSNVFILPERPRQGCVRGYNRAFSCAHGRWVIYLNDDAEVMLGYDREAISFMERNPEIGLGALYYAENTLPYRINEYHDMIYANFGIISRELGEKIGFFDEVVQMYGNDNSLAFRVLLEGYGIAGIPMARIWHHSVMDCHKIENQELRPGDSHALMEKYRRYLPQMQRVHDRYRHLTPTLVLGE